jgi:tRNA (mo5U34)-methyltransferase
MPLSKEQLEEMVRSVPYWWHAIDLGHGVVTPGHKSAEHLAAEIQSLRLPDLRGKSVLDVGAWDGFYSFEAERRGARRVVALDHFCWALHPMDLVRWDLKNLQWDEELAAAAARHEEECNASGINPWYQPMELPGKRGFDIARRALDSRVEAVAADFMEMDLKELGTFDVVFFLGVLYHLEHPLEALTRLAAVTREVAIIETDAVLIPGYEHHAICEFYESNEYNDDVTNWWSPNEKALQGLSRAAGFERVETVAGPPCQGDASTSKPDGGRLSKPSFAISSLLSTLTLKKKRAHSAPPRLGIQHYRAVAHAWKGTGSNLFRNSRGFPAPRWM